MSDPSEYRSRTKAVRGAARERLRQLREERLSRRGEPLVAGAAVRSSDAESQGIAVSRAASLVTDAWTEGSTTDASTHSPAGMRPSPEPAAGASEQGQPAADREESESLGHIGDKDFVDATAKVSSVETPPVGGSTTDVGVRQEQAPVDATEQSGDSVEDAPLAAAPRGIPAVEIADATAPSVKPPEASDLLKLPGAGAGLVWMLGQCGITSLEALGRADPDELTERMGLVGQMLDVNGWIGFARAEGGETDTRPLGSV